MVLNSFYKSSVKRFEHNNLGEKEEGGELRNEKWLHYKRFTVNDTSTV